MAGKSGGGAKLAFTAFIVAGLASGAHAGASTGHGHGHGTPSLDSVAAVPASGGGSVAANIALGEKMAAAKGWTGSQWSCLYTLWQGESGWSQYADTRKSGLDPPDAAVFAYGIPQSRPAEKMPKSAWPADLGGQSKPGAQIGWGLTYIDDTYQNPCNALSFKQAHGDKGY